MSTVHRFALTLSMLAFGVPVTLRSQPVPTANRAESATQATLSGTVTDAATRRPVIRAEVRIRGTERRAFTDLNGRFIFRAVAPGRVVLDVRRIGYQPLIREGVLVGEQPQPPLALIMTPNAIRLAEMTIAPGAFSLLGSEPSIRQTLSRAQIEEAPFGEDLFRAMNRLPGLSSNDYGAQFSIRGGRQDETLILLDGLEIFEPFHLKDFNEGALSIFDVEAIDGVQILTGGFPARYGDKRSGVMNITSRRPEQNAGTQLRFGASLSNAHLLAEGTFRNQKGSWLVSGRRGFFDVLLRIINKREAKAPSYQDAFGTLRYQLHPRHSVTLHTLYAGDRYRFSIKGTTGFNDSIKTSERADNAYGNSYVWLTVHSLVGEHVTINTMASVGAVTASREGNERHLLQPIELYAVNGSRDFTVTGLKQDFSYQRSERLVLDWGYDARSLRASFDWTSRVIQNPDNPLPDTTGYYPRVTRRIKQANGTTLGAYLSNRVRIADPLTFELGVRYDAASYTHEQNWSPRLQALLRLAERTSLRAGWGAYRQRQGIADENAFDRLDRYFPSELSEQWTAGVEHRYADGGLLRAEGYYKLGSALRPILRNWKSGLNVFPESSEDRILVYPEATTSKGMELYHERKVGRRLNVRAGYALSFVEERVRRVDNINDPRKLLFDSTHAAPQDQRHAFNADVSFRPVPSWTVNSALTYHSGWPYTAEIGVPVRRRNGSTDLLVRPDSLYQARLPAYQRLDVRVTKRRVTARGEMRFFVELINVLNHENVLGYDVFTARDATGAIALQRNAETWFSILPSFGVNWSRRW